MQLAEEDLDKFDVRHKEILSTVNSLRKTLVGLLISLATASLLLVINLSTGAL